MFKPLSGIKIVDLTSVLAGPYSTYQLGLLGAEIIKLENLDQGDWTRVSGKDEKLNEISMGNSYLVQNAGKKSIQLDLKSSKGLFIARKLIKEADVFVENMRPGKAEKLGLGWTEIKKINNKIIYCSISAYGQDGPLSKRGAYDHVVQGMSGIMTTTGSKGNGPTKVGAAYVDYSTGLNAAFSIVSALHETKVTKKAVKIDVSMLDTSLLLMANMITEHLNSGWIPTQMGNEAQSGSPSSGLYKTKSSYLLLAANTQKQFFDLCEALNTISYFDKNKWLSLKDRNKNKDQLRQEFQDIFILKSAEELEILLNDYNVPSAKVRTIPEVTKEEHFKKRQLWNNLKIPSIEKTFKIPSLGFKVNDEVIKSKIPPPILGENTVEILKSIGFKYDEIEKLRLNKVIK